MKRITKNSTTDALRTDKVHTTSVVPNVVEMPTLSISHLSEVKVSNLSCEDDTDNFQEDMPTADSFLINRTDANTVTNVTPFLGYGAVGVGSCSEEVVSDDSNEGVLCPLSNEGTEKQEFTMGVINHQVLECRNSISQVLHAEDRSDSMRGVKVEPSEMMEMGYVKFEELCICTCHFAPVYSCCSGTPESMHTASSRDNILVVNDSEASVHVDSIDRDVDCRDSSVVVGTIDTHIVGRKFSMEAVCEVGMSLAFVRDADNPKDSNAVKVGVTLWRLSFLICLRLRVNDANFLAFHVFVKLQNYLYKKFSRESFF